MHAVIGWKTILPQLYKKHIYLEEKLGIWAVETPGGRGTNFY